MFDPKSKEALLKNLVDTWGPEGFATAAKIVAQYEESMTKPHEPVGGQIGSAPPDLIRVKDKLIQIAQQRQYMHAKLDRISNDLSVLIHGQGTLWKDRECDEGVKGYDWKGMGIWSLLELVESQIDCDSNTISNIICRLDNEEPTHA